MRIVFVVEVLCLQAPEVTAVIAPNLILYVLQMLPPLPPFSANEAFLLLQLLAVVLIFCYFPHQRYRDVKTPTFLRVFFSRHLFLRCLLTSPFFLHFPLHRFVPRFYSFVFKVFVVVEEREMLARPLDAWRLSS